MQIQCSNLPTGISRLEVADDPLEQAIDLYVVRVSIFHATDGAHPLDLTRLRCSSAVMNIHYIHVIAFRTATRDPYPLTAG